MRATSDIKRYNAKMEVVPKVGLQWKAKTLNAAQQVQAPPVTNLKPITFRRRTVAERMDLRKANKCFICAEGGHIAKSCPYQPQYSKWV